MTRDFWVGALWGVGAGLLILLLLHLGAGCAPVAAPKPYTGTPEDVPVAGDTWSVDESTAEVDLFPPEPAREVTPEPDLGE